MVWNTTETTMSIPLYVNGRTVQEKDKVLVHPRRVARVKLLLPQGSDLAKAYSCPEGGFVLEFEDGDCQVWARTDADIQLLKRGSAT